MRIKKIFNNNILLVQQNDQEMILTGCGIGFQKSFGELVELNKIEKCYIRNHQLIYEIDQSKKIMRESVSLKIANQLMNEVEQRYHKYYNSLTIDVLTWQINILIQDHIQSPIIIGKILPMLKQYYQLEYQIGLLTVQLIERNTSIQLSESAAGLIAIRLIGTEYLKVR